MSYTCTPLHGAPRADSVPKSILLQLSERQISRTQLSFFLKCITPAGFVVSDCCAIRAFPRTKRWEPISRNIFFTEPRAWKTSIILAGRRPCPLPWASIRPLSGAQCPQILDAVRNENPKDLKFLLPWLKEVPTQVNPPITCFFFCVQDEADCADGCKRGIMDADQRATPTRADSDDDGIFPN